MPLRCADSRQLGYRPIAEYDLGRDLVPPFPVSLITPTNPLEAEAAELDPYQWAAPYSLMSQVGGPGHGRKTPFRESGS
jgi:hypothetical protein